MISRRARSFALGLALTGCGADGELNLLGRGQDAAPDGAGDATASDAATDAGLDAVAVVDAGADAAAPCMDAGCPCGLTLCGTSCVDLMNDPAHCGTCTTGALHYQYCQAGHPQCVPGFTLCAGACRDFASDPDHCGGCANPACTSGQKCENGVCAAGACGAGLTGCAVAGGRTACVNIAHGTPYCGDCSTVCGPDQVCASGTCHAYAPATPCAACPCAADCARTEGSPSSCCPGLGGGVQPICVSGTSCP